MTRKEKFWSAEYRSLEHDKDSLRFATNEYAAKHRAKRLACDHLVEIGAGIGFQTIAFARTCKKLTAIELDPVRCAMLRTNLKKLHIKNVDVIEGDAIDTTVFKNIKKYDVVFCDPERPAEEKKRSLDKIKPSPAAIRKAYKAKTYCFEVPPQMQDIPGEYEKEYLSLNHKVNRLDLYLSEKKQPDSVVLLETGKVLKDSGKQAKVGKDIKNFIYEVDSAVEKAGMVGSIPVDAELLQASNRVLLTADKQLQNPFLTGYHVLTTVTTHAELVGAMGKMKAEEVILRYPIEPAQYWKERKELESKLLPGNRKLHIFEIGQKYIISERF